MHVSKPDRHSRSARRWCWQRAVQPIFTNGGRGTLPAHVAKEWPRLCPTFTASDNAMPGCAAYPARKSNLNGNRPKSLAGIMSSCPSDHCGLNGRQRGKSGFGDCGMALPQIEVSADWRPETDPKRHYIELGSSRNALETEPWTTGGETGRSSSSEGQRDSVN